MTTTNPGKIFFIVFSLLSCVFFHITWKLFHVPSSCGIMWGIFGACLVHILLVLGTTYELILSVVNGQQCCSKCHFLPMAPDKHIKKPQHHQWMKTKRNHVKISEKVVATSPVQSGLSYSGFWTIPSTMNNLMNNQDLKFSSPLKDYTSIGTILEPKLTTEDCKQAQTPVDPTTGLLHNHQHRKVIIPKINRPSMTQMRSP